MILGRQIGYRCCGFMTVGLRFWKLGGVKFGGGAAFLLQGNNGSSYKWC